MPISITGDQTLTLVIGIFAIVGFIRGWRKMGVVFVGTLLTGIVLLQDDTRLISTINKLPKIVDVALDTKFGLTPMITNVNRPYWMLGILVVAVVISWILSDTLVKDKGTKVDWNRPVQAMSHALTSMGVGAGTGYLIVIRGYEYLLALNAEQQKQVFQGFTVILQPLPKANVLVQYESLLFIAMILLAIGVIFGSKIFGSGYGRGKSESKGSRD